MALVSFLNMPFWSFSTTFARTHSLVFLEALTFLVYPFWRLTTQPYFHWYSDAKVLYPYAAFLRNENYFSFFFEN